MKKLKVSVIVPVFNEAANLHEFHSRLLGTLNRLGNCAEVIYVDDASTDKSLSILKKLADTDTSARVVLAHNPTRCGIYDSIKRGLGISSSPLVATIDADLQYRPEDLFCLYQDFTHSNADLVSGWRSPFGREQDKQSIESRLLRLIFNMVLGISLKDARTGFLITYRDVLQDLIDQKKSEQFFNAFLVPVAVLRGYSVKEVEVWFDERLTGSNRFPKWSPKLLVQLLGSLIAVALRFRFSSKKIDEHPLEPLLAYLPKQTRRTQHKPLWRRVWFRFYMLTFPLHHWMITARSGVYYNQLQRTQWLSREQMRQHQEAKLRQLVRHAYRHVPYYRRQFEDLGIRPEDINSLDDLSKLPLLTKAAIRENVHFDLLADNHKKSDIYRISTSGSTGAPMTIYVNRCQLELRWAATLRCQEWAGYRFGDRCARLWHQTIGMRASQVIREKLDAWFTRRLFIPAFEMSEARIASFVKKLVRYKPLFIDGYAESFNFLASYLQDGDLGNIRVRGIMSSAQSLPNKSRELIEAAFRSKVFDKYGSREFSGIAYESESRDGHLVNDELYIVEILKDGAPASPGEIGEIVVTDLHNKCMPLIRYRIGDLGVAMDPNSLSKSGRPFSRIGEIQGRTQAIILGTHGRFLPGTFFAHFFKEYEHTVQQFQLIQEDLNSITLKIIKGKRFEPKAYDTLLNELRRFVGEDMIINTDFVEKIPLVRTGKHTATISKLNLDFQRLSLQK